jgi:hypothetical protein
LTFKGSIVISTHSLAGFGKTCTLLAASLDPTFPSSGGGGGLYCPITSVTKIMLIKRKRIEKVSVLFIISEV